MLRSIPIFLLLLGGYFLAFAAGPTFALGEQSGPPRCTDIKGDKIKLECTKVPLWQLLSEIYRHTGIDFSLGNDTYEKEVSVRHSYLPIAEGVKKVLRNQNFSFIFNRDGKLVKVVCLGGKTSDLSVRLSAAAAPKVIADANEKDPLEPLETNHPHMEIDHSPVVMEISPSDAQMEILPYTEQMEIQETAFAMEIEPYGEQMEIFMD